MASDQNHAEEKVVFSPEQQVRLDEIVKEAQGRAAKELRVEAERSAAKVAELQEAMDKLLADAAKNAKKSGDAPDEVEDLKSKIAEMKEASRGALAEVEKYRKQIADKDKAIEDSRRESDEIRKRIAITKAAETANFISPEDVYDLTSKHVKWNPESGKFVVVTESGTERLNASYEPMSLDEFYVDYASKKPFLVRGDAVSGVGSSESQRSALSVDGKHRVQDIFGKDSDSAKANALARSNKKEYLRLKGIAQESGLI